MHVTITGSDLDYFKQIVSGALNGNYGSVDEVRIDVIDNKIQFSTGSTASAHIGAVHDSPESPSAGTVSEEPLIQRLNREYSGYVWKFTVTNE